MAFKNFLGTLGLVELKPEEQQKKSAPVVDSINTTTPLGTGIEATPITGNTPPTLTGGTVDPKLMAHFEEVFTKANIPGPDFYEYSQTLHNLQGVITDEAVLYPAAFAAFRAQAGAGNKTVADLVAAVDHYIQAVNADDTFQKQVDAKKSTVLAGLTAQKDKLTSDVITWQQQLNDLAAKIAGSNQSLTDISGQIMTEENKLANSIANFNVTRQNVIDGLKNQSAKMLKYIKV